MLSCLVLRAVDAVLVEVEAQGEAVEVAILRVVQVQVREGEAAEAQAALQVDFGAKAQPHREAPDETPNIGFHARILFRTNSTYILDNK